MCIKEWLQSWSIGSQPCSIQDKVYNEGSINYYTIKKSSAFILYFFVFSHLVLEDSLYVDVEALTARKTV